MKAPLKYTLALAGVTALAVAPAVNAATTSTTISGFDPNTYFSGGVTAGIDFDDGTSSNYPAPTQPGFLSIPASNAKTYNVTTGGITFDIDVSNANFGNQNRNRNNVNAGRIMNDFEQWYGGRATAGTPVEAKLTLTGLVANTDYEISLFTYNVGSGQVTHSFYDGTSSAAPLITTFTTAGTQNNYATWTPGVVITANSGSSSQIDLTIQASEFFNAGPARFDSRLTLDGVSVIQGATIPEPSSTALLGLGGLALILRRRK
ncbi:MAG: PEP-CTERM sorting domain-containing protein [Akkermansiaceae bacterium]